jgi:DNA-binding Lrp family transcriptional regulator
MPEKIVAYLLLGTDMGREKEIADALREIHGVTEVHVVYGEFDVLTHLECGDLKALDASITRARKVEGVIRTMTLIAG